MTLYPVSSSTRLPSNACNLNGPTESHSTIAISRSCSHKICNVQIYIGKTKTVLLLEILFTLFILHFITKKARTTETVSVTWWEHDVNIVCVWLTSHPTAVFHSFWPGRNQACLGNTRQEKECEIFDWLLKRTIF